MAFSSESPLLLPEGVLKPKSLRLSLCVNLLFDEDGSPAAMLLSISAIGPESESQRHRLSHRLAFLVSIHLSVMCRSNFSIRYNLGNDSAIQGQVVFEKV